MFFCHTLSQLAAAAASDIVYIACTKVYFCYFCYLVASCLKDEQLDSTKMHFFVLGLCPVTFELFLMT